MISPPSFLSSNFLSFRTAASTHPSPPPSPRLHTPPLSASFSGAATTAPEPALTTTSLYDVLGLPAGANPVEIKAAYRRLARTVHPDVAAAAASADEFIRIHAAYSTLSDPDKRADYDRQLLSLGGVSSRRYQRRYPSPPPQQPPPPRPHTAAWRYPSFGRSPSFPGYYRRSRRTWETDQCW